MNNVVVFIGQLHPVVADISMEGRGRFNLTASPTLVCTGKSGDAVGGGASAAYKLGSVLWPPLLTLYQP